MPHVVVMVATSYPRFPGDGVGSFMEPIAKGVAARGHDVHLVAPWHPAITRAHQEDGVTFHFYRYAPASLNVFGYAQAMHADTHLKVAAWAVAPAALVAGWRCASHVATVRRATVMHGHWLVPGGVTAMLAARGRPLVVSLHGSDVFVAERHWTARRAARAVLRRAAWTTACSEDLRGRAVALGADPSRIETLPYGVDILRFAPNVIARRAVRSDLGIGDDVPMIFSAGRLVRKKGFEFLIDAMPFLAREFPAARIVIAGAGDLASELGRRASSIAGGHVTLLGSRSQDQVGRLAAAADVVVVPSVRDTEGNVDGLPNFALEAMATATPVVATSAGGLGEVIVDGVHGRTVSAGDAEALARAVGDLLRRRTEAKRMGASAREHVAAAYGWARVAEHLERAYDRATPP